MQLTEHKPQDYNHIRRVDDEGIVIGDQRYTGSLLVGAHLLETDWPLSSLADLDKERLTPIWKLSPELVLIGIGDRQQIAPIELQRAFLERHIGLECMTLQAACRTFNVLMSENRRALALLIQ